MVEPMLTLSPVKHSTSIKLERVTANPAASPYQMVAGSRVKSRFNRMNRTSCNTSHTAPMVERKRPRELVRPE